MAAIIPTVQNQNIIKRPAGVEQPPSADSDVPPPPYTAEPLPGIQDGGQSGVQKPLGFVRRHTGWFLLSGAALSVLIICLIIFVAMQRVAQNVLNGTKLNNTATLRFGESMTDNGSTDFALDSNVVKIYKYYNKYLLDDFWATLSVEGTGTDVQPFARAKWVGPSWRMKVDWLLLYDGMVITDLQQMAQFCTRIIQDEEARIVVRGKTKISLLESLPKYKVDFNKVYTVPGLGGRWGYNISSSPALVLFRNRSRPDDSISYYYSRIDDFELPGARVWRYNLYSSVHASLKDVNVTLRETQNDTVIARGIMENTRVTEDGIKHDGIRGNFTIGWQDLADMTAPRDYIEVDVVVEGLARNATEAQLPFWSAALQGLKSRSRLPVLAPMARESLTFRFDGKTFCCETECEGVADAYDYCALEDVY